MEFPKLDWTFSQSFVMNNETPVIMLAHGVLFGWVSYLIMHFLLGQVESKAEGRSIVIGLIVSLYFVLFGLRAPTRINPVLL